MDFVDELISGQGMEEAPKGPQVVMEKEVDRMSEASTVLVNQVEELTIGGGQGSSERTSRRRREEGSSRDQRRQLALSRMQAKFVAKKKAVKGQDDRNRKPYSWEEGQAILKTLASQRFAFKYIGGVNLWKQLSVQCFPHRSFESLRDHFRKAVLPKVLLERGEGEFKMEESEFDHLLNSINYASRPENKHRMVCPFYNFNKKRRARKISKKRD